MSWRKRAAGVVGPDDTCCYSGMTKETLILTLGESLLIYEEVETRMKPGTSSKN